MPPRHFGISCGQLFSSPGTTSPKFRVDPCLFHRPDCMLVVYVDDCLLFSRPHPDIEKIISDLAKEFTLTDEVEVATYLGVYVKSNDDGKIDLFQPFLIK